MKVVIPLSKLKGKLPSEYGDVLSFVSQSVWQTCQSCLCVCWILHTCTRAGAFPSEFDSRRKYKWCWNGSKRRKHSLGKCSLGPAGQLGTSLTLNMLLSHTWVNLMCHWSDELFHRFSVSFARIWNHPWIQVDLCGISCLVLQPIHRSKSYSVFRRGLPIPRMISCHFARLGDTAGNPLESKMPVFLLGKKKIPL